VSMRSCGGGVARRGVAAAAQKNDSLLDGIKRVAKKVQGGLPIIGLLSRLTSSEGGFDELAYPEYARSVINAASVDMRNALLALEEKHGKPASSRWVLLLLWMAKTGTGLVPPGDVMNAAKRMRITQDMEIEIDRFVGARERTMKKYEMISPPEPKTADVLAVAVDAMATLCLGLKESEPISDADAALLSAVLESAIPEADSAAVSASISARPTRIWV